MSKRLLSKKTVLALFLFTSFFTLTAQVQIGNDIDGEALGDRSGGSVALSSDGAILAIGARFNDGNGSNSGHVRVYENINGTWTQIGSDIDGEAEGDSFGWSIDLSSDGTILAIGAYLNDGNGRRSGHVQVYENINGMWTQIGSDIDGEAAEDTSGTVSLSSNGTILAIGAYSNDGNGNGNSGHVRVYENINGTWTQIGSDIDGEATSDTSSWSIDLSSDGTILAIGAYLNDGNGNNSGHVRIYENINGTWTQVGSDIDGEAAEDRFGYSVALSSDGTILSVGAFGNNGNGAGNGHVQVYENINGTWTQIGSDINGEAAGDSFGHSVTLSSDGIVLAAGSWRNSENGFWSGHVRIYKNTNGAWIQIGNDIDGEAAEDRSGHSVALSSDGTTLAIGANRNDDNGTDSGHVRVYDLFPILPVELVYFEGIIHENYHLLKWATTSEIDNAGFSLERSADGKTWKQLAFIKGSGTSLAFQQYEWKDNAPLNRTNYYRLKQLDIDGSFEYSELIAMYQKEVTSIHIQPNPVKEILYYVVNDLSNVQAIYLFDLQGRVIKTATNFDGELALPTIKTGIYLLKIQMKDQVLQEIFVKL